MFENLALAVMMLTQTELECVAKNIYFEARNQSYAGKMATAQVVFNRVESERFPDSACDVVYQARTNSAGQPIRNQCQFSWFCDGLSDVPREHDAYIDAVTAAQDASILWRNGYDLTEGATFYHSQNVNPRWNRDMDLTVTIDDHLFYKDE